MTTARNVSIASSISRTLATSSGDSRMIRTTPPRLTAVGSFRGLLRMSTVAGFLLLLAGCGGSERPGSPQVYANIEAMTECAELQATFDRNMDDAERREPGSSLRDVVLSYAETADDRMRDLGCFG